MVLSLAILIAWNAFIAPRIWPPEEEQPRPAPPAVRRPVDTTNQAAKPQPVEPAVAPQDLPADASGTQDQPPVVPEKQPDVQEATLENEYLKLKLTNVGGTITDAYLKKYDEDTTNKSPLRLLAPIAPNEHSLALRLASGQGLAERRFHVVRSSDREVVYQTDLPNKLRVKKTIELPEGAYHAMVKLELMNLSGKEMQVAYRLYSAAGILPERPAYEKAKRIPLSQLGPGRIEGAVGAKGADGTIKVTRKAPGKVEDEPETVGDLTVAWAGVKNKYFSAVLKPMQDRTVLAGRISALGKTNVTSSLESRAIKLEPNGFVSDDYMFFVGPNSKELMTKPAYATFAGLHSLRWPKPVTRLFIGILHTFYGIAGNYGLAIIMLTLVVRAALHPLTRKSQKSMHAMQKLGPKMKEIKNKHKDDKKRQQMETMKLYKEHGVNPMGGCLPIILQLPILFGLFGALQSAIELRLAPFVLWMKDLSQPDALTMLPPTIPFMGGRPLNVLPIMMIVAMVLQQKFTPKPSSGDAQSEQTQKMMMWMMPIMFGFLFYGMPSGLVLYFMTSTGLGALESHLIRSHMAKLGTVPEKKDTKKKKETWVDRAARSKAARGRKLK